MPAINRTTMKARIKATGEIVEVKPCEEWTTMHGEILTYISDDGVHYSRHALSFKIDDERDEHPDYWARLEHQAAIAAMQGILSNQTVIEAITNCKATMERVIPLNAYRFAHALVEKLKEKEK